MPEIIIEVGDQEFIADVERLDATAGPLIIRALNDIRDEIAETAREYIPRGVRHPVAGNIGKLGVPGLLKEIGIIEDRGIEVLESDSIFSAVGEEEYEARVGLNREPRYGEWVHEGTGLYGPSGRPIVATGGNFMRFAIDGRWFSLYMVEGQKPNPFLRDAFIYVNETYVPARVRLLAQEIDLAT